MSLIPCTPEAASQALNAANFDLWGSRLIEASAGTGKTWTIAALYLRLVLGHGGAHGFERPLRPAEILVMTFTRAATRELSDRIRGRLLEAARVFRSEQALDADDEFLSTLLSAYAPGLERKRAAWALANAAESMDDAAIHTIDAWCQRMLREHAFDSGSLFDEELVADEEAMRTEAAQDYWRQQCYDLDAQALAHILGVWPGVDALVADVRALQNQAVPASAGLGTLGEVLQHALQLRQAALDRLKAGWSQRAQTMLDWLDGQTASKNNGWDGRKLSPANYRRWLANLDKWADGREQDELPDLKSGWDRFTPEGLLEARKVDAQSLEIPPEFSQFVVLKEALEQLPDVRVALRLHAAASVAQRLLQLKRQSGSFGFADMLNRLHAALQGDKGQNLRKRILAQYPVILVDEFQDTSPLQYQIFDLIYQTNANDPHSALLLIGDPKQSIYGFRGADIHSYLAERRATSGRHYMLATNYRSTQDLVAVVNHWFAQAEQRQAEGAFRYRLASSNPLPFESVQARGRKEHLTSQDGPVPAMTLLHELALHNADTSRQRFAARCAEQIVHWLNDGQAGFARPPANPGADATFTALRPADMAVLVRTGKEAAAVRRALAQRGVASVYLSDKESVFESQEAHDLLHWLRAVAQPQDMRLVRAGLATATLGLRLDELGLLASQDEAFDERSAQLSQLRQVWQTQGVLAMLRQSLHQLGLPVRWLASPNGERKLTNFLHLAELLQNASSSIDGEQALIRWLTAAIDEKNASSDEQIVRLESDADLVKVITIHKSKGLEFPVVCLPFVTSFRATEKKNTAYITLANEAGQQELLLQYSDAQLARADQDRLREDLRLLYVALTRARHALWVGFAAVKVGNSDSCVIHDSAAGYLLGGSVARDATEWLAPLQEFATACPAIRLQAAAPGLGRTPLSRAPDITTLQDPPPYQADFERNWRIGSFSRLTRDLLQMPQNLEPSELSPLRVSRPADDETDLDTSAPASQPEPQQTFIFAAPAPWHSFARGPQAGNFLHEQLEWLAAEHFALPGNEALAARLVRRCERAGRGAHADTVVHWLSELVQTRLPGVDAALLELDHVLPEMEFWLPAQHMPALAIDALCREHLLPGLARPGLAQQQLHGMLMGFADLVFEHQGRFWVLDYKSNHLGEQDAAYDTQSLEHAMAAHRYDVQAALYMLALHRLLRMRLGSQYQPTEHLGGAVYLFLRGIQGPQQGVCWLPAPPPLLEALDAMLLAEEAAL